MQEIIVSWFSGLPNELATFLIAMVPVTELRAAIPIAILKFNLNPWSAFIWAVLGSASLGSLVVLLVEPVTKLAIERIGFLHRIWQRYIGRLERKHKASFERWEAWALVIFIAIPLPMTGAVSGAIIASIFQVEIKRAIPLIFLGCSIAGVIVTLMTIGFTF